MCSWTTRGLALLVLVTAAGTLAGCPGGGDTGVKPTAAFTASPDRGLAPLAVSFADRSEAGDTPIAAWRWDFGDGSSSTEQHPTHTYSVPGAYAVTLTVFSPSGNATLKTPRCVNAQCLPSAQFSAAPLTGLEPLTVTFRDQSVAGTSPITHWRWDFGDGTMSTERHPTHLYPQPGSYDVSLTVTTAVGEYTRRKPGCVQVKARPQADFTAEPLSGYAPLEVIFTDASTPGSAPLETWLWDFGDGATSDEPSPTHTYARAGAYTVSLRVRSALGSATRTRKQYISVKEAPIAAFAADVTRGEAPLTVQFSDTSSPGSAPIASWAWDFGDGSVSDRRNPTHTYSAPGLYTVTLAVTTADGEDAATRPDYVSAYVLPRAAFSLAPETGAAPLAVRFTDESVSGSSPITAWLWDFGDGANSSEPNPSHTYAQPGTYSVSLTVTTDVGANRAERAGCVKTVARPTAGFSATPRAGVPPLTTQFTDESVAGDEPITAWRWNFGDGTTSEERHPAHTYTGLGTYTVTLTVTSAVGSDACAKTHYIVAQSPPTADFTLQPADGLTPLTVRFTDTSSSGWGDLIAWRWDFGDGQTGNVQHPVHVYGEAGTYSVTLKVTNGVGSHTTTKTDCVVVRPVPPEAAFEVDTTKGVRPCAVTFTDRSAPGSSPITGWQWDFGDGSVSAEANPTHVYTERGYFDVSLTVTTDAGSDSVSKTDLVRVVIPLELDETFFVPVTELGRAVTPEFLPVRAAVNELLLGVRVDITMAELNVLLGSMAALDCHVVGYSTPSRVLQARYPAGRLSSAMILALRALPCVTFVVPNQVCDLEQYIEPGDNHAGRALADADPEARVARDPCEASPRSDVTWYPQSFSGDYWIQGIRADRAWGLTTGAPGILLAVVDAGFTHWKSLLGTPRATAMYYDGTPGAYEGGETHGSWLAALAAGDGADTRPAVGVAWKNPLLLVSWKKGSVGVMTELIAAIDRALTEDARVVTVSAGVTLDTEAQGFEEAFERNRMIFREALTGCVDHARRRNALLCFSAGNDGFGIDANHMPSIDTNNDGDMNDDADRPGNQTAGGLPCYIIGETVRADDDYVTPEANLSPASWEHNALIVAASARQVRTRSAPTFADTYIRVGAQNFYQQAPVHGWSYAPEGRFAQFTRLGEVTSLAAPGFIVGCGGGDVRHGTSYAAALTAGSAALALSASPTLAAPEVRRALLDTADMNAVKGAPVAPGTGLLDVRRTVAMANAFAAVPNHAPILATLSKGETRNVDIDITVPDSVFAVDVMIVTDISGSYYDDLVTIKEKARDLVEALTDRLGNVQFGVATFCDFPFVPYGSPSDVAFALDQPITDDLDEVYAAIDAITILSGSDVPESQLECLYQLATGEGLDLNDDGDYDDLGEIEPSDANWRPGALRVVVFSTDAQFHDSDLEPDYPGHGLTDTLAALQAARIMVLGLYTGAAAETALTPVVEATGGALFPLDDDSGNLIEAVIGALDDSLTNLDLSLEVLNDPEGFIASITPERFTGVSLGDTVTFHVGLEGALNASLTTLNYDIRLWALVNDTCLVQRAPVWITVTGTEDGG